jgi:uncharacterized protein (DUF2235 family)
VRILNEIGLDNNIKDAFTFICQNYDFSGQRDDIILIGFSRGAFTARCVASMINRIGLLTPAGLYHLPKLYEYWSKQTVEELADEAPDWDTRHAGKNTPRPFQSN